MTARQDYSSHEKVPDCLAQRVVGRVSGPAMEELKLVDIGLTLA